MAKVEAKPTMEVKSDKPQESPRGARLDETLMKPGKYEVTNEHTFKVEVNLGLRNNRWVVVEGIGKGVDSNEVIFRMWTYDEMIELKKMATSYDAQKRIHMIDHDLLNRLKVQRLMVSWTFGKDNPRLKLAHTNGVLTDESWVAFTKLQPNIVTYIIDEMNKVYEYNG
jgi:hypothetical protein